MHGLQKYTVQKHLFITLVFLDLSLAFGSYKYNLLSYVISQYIYFL